MNAREAIDARLPDLPRLPAALPRSGVSPEARLALRQILGDNERALAHAYHAGADVATLVHLRARAVGAVVVHAWRSCVGEAGECVLVAVGGFGRGLLFPQSDVDLLALGEPDALARQARALEAFFACLWDIGLKPGHAVRTLTDCRSLAADDVSVYTALMDARLLAGERYLADALAALVADPALWPAPAFIAAKRAEQSARHARYNDTTYNLEPNLKDGPGGLRTLDLMRWLGRRVADAGDFHAMVERGLLDRTECTALERAEATLWRYRYALHLAAGRPEERLLFDYQRRLAGEFGYEDEHATNLAVEQFMQAYYRAATIAERLGVQFLERCTELLEPATGSPRELDRDFVALGARVELREPDLFLRRPRAMVDVFVVPLDHPELRGLSAETMRRLQQALAHYGDGFAADAHVLGAFLALLRRGAPAVEALARMNRHGVLAAILPAFRRVVGRMQYDLFHVYTVDEHTLRVLRNVARYADADAAASMPLAAEVFAALDKPELLLLAALFHDIAKGRGGDHSELGEEEARAFCARMDLPEPDIDLVAWLVRWHLLMSVTAQRQDITDPDVVHRFAVQVGDRERLDHLYLLTIADIAGTNPKLWNEWKARLLADLHMAARYVLRADLGRPLHADERAVDCRARTRELLVEGGVDAMQAERWLDAFPQSSFLRHRPAQLARQARAIATAGPGGIVVAVNPQSSRGGSELFVCAPDRDGLFAAIAATLDRQGLGVVDARLLVGAEGRVFDTFELLDAHGGSALSLQRAGDLEAALRRVLEARELVARVARRSLPRRLRHFQRPPQIEFGDVEGATQLALVCSDRPGLLAEVAQALRESRVRVHDARIATFGERVEDFFVLTDENDAVLTEATRHRLRASLLERLGAESP
ncbi:[protein-PII] uridylyltransferase [Dokdonella fugitiva]|uniref:Bifunctional uridylyltransferase/uridylyl-removing enzyme n=1 Tax=Dokdonella fugitiva TaxID=328517 RepID=A0A839F3Q1_9GAMM|nr:[protein-PII] uridylyltransferase [Dokdonella fugitiva]MBA8888168.1 [protein-PII] uridylyltransferase [Dokdonella fugitiva]